MMELIERKNAKEEWKLPKNIRQIGEPGQGIKVLIEDYAYTFLHQLAQENLTCVRTAMLVGRIEAETGLYIQGAIEIDMGQEPKGWFSHEHWRMIFKEVQDWFEGMEIVGWCMANPGFPTVLTEELRSLHQRNFSGNHYVFLQMDVLENEEVFYIRRDSELSPLCGYYIYYEKNERMQAYISQKKGGASIEPEGILRDRAAAKFRNMMQEKKEQTTQKKTLAFLYTSCTFLVMVILVIGITMINNYDRMSNMETAIHQISESLEHAEQDPMTSAGGSVEGTIEEAVEAENQQALALQESSSSEETAVEPEEALPDETIQQPEEETQEVMSQAVKEPERYQVKVGDTLLGICRSYYGTDEMVDQICELNDLEDSDKIYVGETILLP